MKCKTLPTLNLLLLIFLSSANAFGQKFTVNKIKGNQAVIEFTGSQLILGQTYDFSSEEFPLSTSENRNHIISLSLNFSDAKSDAINSTSSADLNLLARFGWNFGTFEFGPIGSYSSLSRGGLTSTTLKLGGFADYNFNPNFPGEAFVYGLGASISGGIYDPGVGGQTDLMGVFVGPFAKWFPWEGPVGFRIELGYIYENISGVLTSSTNTGLGTNVGINAYF